MFNPAIASTTSIAAAGGGRGTTPQIQQGDFVPLAGLGTRFEAAALMKSERIVSRNHVDEQDTAFDPGARSILVPPVLPRLHRGMHVDADAALPQIWEGTVLSVNAAEGSLNAILRAKHGPTEDHVGNVYFEWVMEQDRELVRPGAVFYLTMYRSRLRGGTIVNAQELRFRRLPAWSKSQVRKIEELADLLAKKMKIRPAAE